MGVFGELSRSDFKVGLVEYRVFRIEYLGVLLIRGMFSFRRWLVFCIIE